MGTIYALKTNHITNPVGFFMENITVCWKVRDCAGKHQKSARVIVGTDAALKHIVYDTGERDLNSLGTKLDIPLTPYTRYYWRVSATTDAEERIESSVQFFETGKMQDPWIGKWITCSSEDPRHPVFLKSVNICKEVTSARLYICGLGLYEAYFQAHGTGSWEKIGNEFLTPYCNQYKKWLQYQTYDVTETVRMGGTLGVLLGDGWYKSRFGCNSKVGDPGVFGSQWKLIAELHLWYADGTSQILGTDDSWEMARSNLTFSGIYDGEHRNDMLAPAALERAVLAEPPCGVLMPRLSLPVTEQRRLKPVALLHTPKGETVLDLGQVMTGIFTLRVHEPQGREIVIQTGEVLQDGCFYRDNLRTALSEYRYISDGTQKTIMPHFTFYGYRYVKISGVSHLTCDDFTGIVLHSDFDMIGSLVTGDERINKLISNIKWGMRGNFLDVPTDCPQRDERLGWTGDAQVFSPTACYLADTYAFYKKYLFDLYQEQLLKDGMVPEVIPSVGDPKCSSVWGDAACIIPWNIYLFSGDRSILESQFESMKLWVNFIQKTDGTDHGWRRCFHYGDWMALDRLGANERNVYGATDEAYIADIYYAASAQIVAQTAALLGQKEDERRYQTIADAQWDIVRREYFTQSGRCAINTQTGLLLALKYHLSNDEALTRTMLRKLFRSSGGKLNTGFVGTPLLCGVLTENGMEDIAYQLLLNEEYPGWLYEVKLGATTVWERWNSLDQAGHISSTGMNSLNHYAYGSVLEWMFRSVGGIDLLPRHPGAKHIQIAPKINYALHSASGAYDSAAGRYVCRWEILGTDWIKLFVSVPFDATAQVRLPFAPDSLYQSDHPLFSNVQGGICFIEAGDYEITYQASRQLKPCYSSDSTIEELLSNPAVRHFLAQLVEVDAIPDSAYEFTLRRTAEVFAGPVDEEQIQQLDIALSQF